MQIGQQVGVAIFRIGIERGDIQPEHMIARQVQSELRDAVDHIQVGKVDTVDQVVQQHTALELQVLLGFAGKPAFQLLIALLFGNARLCFFDGLRQAFDRGGLEYKIHHLILDGALCVFKIRESGQHDDLDIRVLLVDAARQLQPIHAGHADIADDDIRLYAGHLLKRIDPVHGLRRDDAAKRFPADTVDQALTDGSLIVHDHDLKHCHPSFLHGAAAQGL